MRGTASEPAAAAIQPNWAKSLFLTAVGTDEQTHKEYYSTHPAVARKKRTTKDEHCWVSEVSHLNQQRASSDRQHNIKLRNDCSH